MKWVKLLTQKNHRLVNLEHVVGISAPGRQGGSAVDTRDVYLANGQTVTITDNDENLEALGVTRDLR